MGDVSLLHIHSPFVIEKWICRQYESGECSVWESTLLGLKHWEVLWGENLPDGAAQSLGPLLCPCPMGRRLFALKGIP